MLNLTGSQSFSQFWGLFRPCQVHGSHPSHNLWGLSDDQNPEHDNLSFICNLTPLECVLRRIVILQNVYRVRMGLWNSIDQQNA